MSQFKRLATVTIGQPGGGGLVIKDNRIVFDIHKDDDDDMNEATVEIYNLSDESRNRIDEIDEVLYLSAGYRDADGEEDIFVGNVVDVTHMVQKPDVITRISVSDGSKEKRDAKSNISYGSGASALTILKRVLSNINLANNLNSVSITDKKYANGFSFSGASTTALDKITNFLGLDWSIQNNEIKLINLGLSDESEVVSLSPATGLIGSPEKFQFSLRKAKGKETELKPGWKITSLLQPKIIPGGRIVVTSNKIPADSIFTVMSVVHSGDTHGRPWESKMEVKE